MLTFPSAPRVVVAENYPDCLELYADALPSYGFRIEPARDGVEAFEKCSTLHPDVLATGLTLAQIDGFELCRRVRHHELTRSIPIVVVTAKTLTEDVELAYRSGADSVLVKPCLPSTLAGEINRLLRTSRSSRLKNVELKMAAAALRHRPVDTRLPAGPMLPTSTRVRNVRRPLRCPACGDPVARTLGGSMRVCRGCGLVLR